MRNSTLDGWTNGVWNQVFSGVTGAPDASGFPTPPYTTLATSPITRERPFLTFDAATGYRVLVPDARTNSSGTTWGAGPTAGNTIPIKEFFIASQFEPPPRRYAVGAAYLRAQGVGRSILAVHGVDRVSDATKKVERDG